MLKFPKGEHDDIIDALAYQLQMTFPYMDRKKKPKLDYKSIIDKDPSFERSMKGIKGQGKHIKPDIQKALSGFIQGRYQEQAGSIRGTARQDIRRHNKGKQKWNKKRN